MKVYAVYSIPKSPEYRLIGLYKTKDLAKQKVLECKGNENINLGSTIYDIQIEEVVE